MQTQNILCCAVLYCTQCSVVVAGTVLYCTQCTVLYCTVLYCTVLYCTVLYCTVLYCTVLYCTVLYCTVLCRIAMSKDNTFLTAATTWDMRDYAVVENSVPCWNAELYCTVLYCTVRTVLYCTVLYCTTGPFIYCHRGRNKHIFLNPILSHDLNDNYPICGESAKNIDKMSLHPIVHY